MVFLITLFTFGTYKLSCWIGEMYFFDKLFYKKSAQHGYIDKNWGNISNIESFKKPVQKRLLDLYQLFYDQKNIERSQDTFNIAIIGDSMTYGLGLKENQTFASILETKLNKIKPTKVYNYSQSGDDIINNFTKYLKAKETKNIDLFIISIVDNDLIFNDVNRYPGNKEVYLKILNKCKQEPIFFKYDATMSWEEMINKLHYPSFSNQHSNICFLKEIISLIDVSNTFFLSFGYVPTKNEFIKQKPDDVISKNLKIFQAYNQIITQYNGYILDPYKYGVKFKEISQKERHPNGTTHRSYADVLYKEIITNKKWHFK